MNIQQAFEEARGAGWEPVDLPARENHWSDVLDYQFWQALDKAMQWGMVCDRCGVSLKLHHKSIAGCGGPDYPMEGSIYYCKKMVAYLFRGGTIEGYFEQL